MFGQGFTDAETEVVRQGVAAGLNYAEIAAKLPGRTKAAIGSKASRMRLRCRKPASESYVKQILQRAAHDQAEDANPNIACDNAFQEAMRKAIAAGLEHAEEGVNLTPCTDNPKLVRPSMPVFMRSAALICFEQGDNTRDIFA